MYMDKSMKNTDYVYVLDHALPIKSTNRFRIITCACSKYLGLKCPLRCPFFIVVALPFSNSVEMDAKLLLLDGATLFLLDDGAVLSSDSLSGLSSTELNLTPVCFFFCFCFSLLLMFINFFCTFLMNKELSDVVTDKCDK